MLFTRHRKTIREGQVISEKGVTKIKLKGEKKKTTSAALSRVVKGHL